ncbi:unnamed protein product [Acanthoscelides obtectus]|uniref:Uncharacterized protein n=1 Tax=Acanthoscelides obtectus TaxID=200917 RepID=A0A9P0KAY4_ACAOB|nr:unnamed protein product [Acanthoscelides obtectus]CAK1645739.1 hypothetical protein AOBTE_LOCUS14231 [Acanthoscelides obtectus]
MCACCMHTCSLARSPCGVPPFPCIPLWHHGIQWVFRP